MANLEKGDAATLDRVHYVAPTGSAAAAADVLSSPVAAAVEEGRSLQQDTPLQVNTPFSTSFGFGGSVTFAVSASSL